VKEEVKEDRGKRKKKRICVIDRFRTLVPKMPQYFNSDWE
jgi:hypothetical protein